MSRSELYGSWKAMTESLKSILLKEKLKIYSADHATKDSSKWKPQTPKTRRLKQKYRQDYTVEVTEQAVETQQTTDDMQSSSDQSLSHSNKEYDPYSMSVAKAEVPLESPTETKSPAKETLEQPFESNSESLATETLDKPHEYNSKPQAQTIPEARIEKSNSSEVASSKPAAKTTFEQPVELKGSNSAEVPNSESAKAKSPTKTTFEQPVELKGSNSAEVPNSEPAKAKSSTKTTFERPPELKSESSTTEPLEKPPESNLESPAQTMPEAQINTGSLVETIRESVRLTQHCRLRCKPPAESDKRIEKGPKERLQMNRNKKSPDNNNNKTNKMKSYIIIYLVIFALGFILGMMVQYDNNLYWLREIDKKKKEMASK